MHVDTEVLREDGDTAVGQSALEDGSYVSAETSRRMACDAATVVMRHRPDGRALDVRRKTRTVSPALRRALAARDHHCRFPGCSVRHCDAHHIRHWADGGSMELDNMLLLCRHHHRSVHEEEFSVEAARNGALRFVFPDGRRLPDAPSAPFWIGPPVEPLRSHLQSEGVTIGPDAATRHWHGEHLNEEWRSTSSGGRVEQRDRPTTVPRQRGRCTNLAERRRTGSWGRPLLTAAFLSYTVRAATGRVEVPRSVPAAAPARSATGAHGRRARRRGA